MYFSMKQPHTIAQVLSTFITPHQVQVPSCSTTPYSPDSNPPL